HVCEAVEKLNAKPGNPSLTLTVIGDTGLDTEYINSFPFVENKGLLPFEEAKALLYSSELFVQNSCFETFGLAPLEALACGCSILMSKNVGALELFRRTDEADVIENYEDADEIASKISSLLQHGNAKKLLAELDKESISWEARTNQLSAKLAQLESDVQKYGKK
ncbi:MAG TPA: glycosyltransferase, partial [Lachnospiraceae bacterium]|nr:glycosyltransferase [Lachnospiraceae bacterium]